MQAGAQKNTNRRPNLKQIIQFKVVYEELIADFKC